MKWALKRELGKEVNHKRIRRVMRLLNLEPQIRRRQPGWFRTTPLHVSKNIINRDFEAKVPNQKWFTDVSYRVPIRAY